MLIKKEDLEKLIGQGVNLVSLRANIYGTIFRESSQTRLEFIYRLSRKTICSIQLHDENLQGHISDNIFFLKRNAGFNVFCFSKLTPIFHTEKGYDERNKFLSKLDVGYFEF